MLLICIYNNLVQVKIDYHFNQSKMGIQKKAKLVSRRFQYFILSYNLLKILLIACLFSHNTSAFNDELINKPCSPNVDGNNIKYQNTSLTLKILLVEFPDIKHSTNPVYTTQNWNDLFFSKGTYFSPNKNSPDGQAVFGSVNDYYNKMSNNNLAITGKIINKDADEDGIPEWIKLKHSKSEYNTVYQLDLITDALAGAAAENLDIDLTKPNTILVIIYSGMVIRETPYLLSPRIGSEKNIYIMGEKFAPFAPYNDHRNDAKFAHIGIHVHELAHCIGLWDLYCNDIKHNNDNGVWDLMASGTYNGPEESGECPAPLNPEMRHLKGWINYQTITKDTEIPQTISYSLENPMIFQLISSKNKAEYFLVEAREFNVSMAMSGSYSPDYNSGIPYLITNGIKKGILIWRVSNLSPGGQIIHSSGLNWTDSKYPPHDVFPGIDSVLVFNPWSSFLKYNDYFWAPVSTPSDNIGLEILSENDNKFNIKFFVEAPNHSSPSRPKNVLLTANKTNNKIRINWSYSNEPRMSTSSGGQYEISRIDNKTDNKWKVLTTTQLNYYIDTEYFFNKTSVEYSLKYKLRAIDAWNQWSTFSDVVSRSFSPIDTIRLDTSKQLITKDNLKQLSNYPNPFNNNTTVFFFLTEDTEISLKLYDLLGRELNTFIIEKKKSGVYNLLLNLSNYPSGIYFLKLKTYSSLLTRKIVLIK